MPHPELHPAVRAFLASPPERAGVFCDFDGTLSSIVSDPAEARPARGAGRALSALASRFAVVAVVSGRPVLDLAARLRAPSVRLVGLHGMEEMAGPDVRVMPEAGAFRDAAGRAVAVLRDELRGMRGVFVEHKGVALAVHFRRAPDPREAQALAAPVVLDAARRAGLDVTPGRLVLELRPPAGGDKGSAVARIAAETGLDAGLFAGDDIGDLPAFEAVRSLAVSVAVGVASSEAADVARVADVIVESPAQVVGLLKALAARRGP